MLGEDQRGVEVVALLIAAGQQDADLLRAVDEADRVDAVGGGAPRLGGDVGARLDLAEGLLNRGRDRVHAARRGAPDAQREVVALVAVDGLQVDAVVEAGALEVGEVLDLEGLGVAGALADLVGREQAAGVEHLGDHRRARLAWLFFFDDDRRPAGAAESAEEVEVGQLGLPAHRLVQRPRRREEQQVLGVRVAVLPLAQLDPVVAHGEVGPRTTGRHGVGAVAGVAALVDDEVGVDEPRGRAPHDELGRRDPVATRGVGGDAGRFRAPRADEAVAAVVRPDGDHGGLGDRLAGGGVDDLAVERADQRGVGDHVARADVGRRAHDRGAGGQEGGTQGGGDDQDGAQAADHAERSAAEIVAPAVGMRARRAPRGRGRPT
ncbi:hypothetical protein OV079_18165 [Nannocystis pusilla]|uniref:Uncharacterized protein n=1 Tax=Nannocystis pusilla TaxID=889268 RepID=A0A9X3EQL1_9BACT|nr:hypothetical protein [Nannocystis pusilla]MCY1007440.1 hypothetical protein [Nannocystis pusilla]